MLKNIVAKFFPAFMISFLFFVLVGYLRSKTDPYFYYQSALPNVRKQPLNNFQELDNIIDQVLSQNLSSKERSIIAGMRWVINFVDNDKNFNAIFSSYILLMHEMTRSNDRLAQRKIAERAVRDALTRAQKDLAVIYPNHENGRWEFIGLLHILHSYPEFKDDYFSFYRRQFKSLAQSASDGKDADFNQALSRRQYKTVGLQIINASFLHYYLLKEGNNERQIELPKDRFLYFLKQFEQFDYDLSHEVGSPEFIDSGFLATHIILVLTNYGEFPIKDDINKNKAKKYIEATLDQVRNLGYLDLLAEYVQSLKILDESHDSRIADLEKFLFSLQRSDGSYGTQEDFSSSPYNAFHPTWTVLTALNH